MVAVRGDVVQSPQMTLDDRRLLRHCLYAMAGVFIAVLVLWVFSISTPNLIID